MKLNHCGTVVSFDAESCKRNKAIRIQFPDGKVTELSISESTVDMFYPSIEGNVMVVILKNSNEMVFDTITGQQLSRQELASKTATFYK